MVNVEHRALCTLEKNGFSIRQRLVEQHCRVADERGDLFGRLRIIVVHLVGVQRLGVKQCMRDHVLLAARILNVRFQQLQIQ